MAASNAMVPASMTEMAVIGHILMRVLVAPCQAMAGQAQFR